MSVSDPVIYLVMCGSDYEPSTVEYATTYYEEAIAAYYRECDEKWYDMVVLVTMSGTEQETIEKWTRY